jgi:Fur family transcriptional regulator, ferric uptake regulator
MERNTRQRDAIREVFVAAKQPLNPFEVLVEGRRTLRGLGIATVYRTINSLVQSGWLNPVELPGDAPRYERSGSGHHHHFQCRGCSGVFEIRGCPGDLKSLTPAGFLLEGHEVVLYGRCGQCAAAQAR